jgi:radical SAM-linked protein
VRGTDGFPVRLRYTKWGKVRWISHRDVARAMERAFRITQLPLAFSQGFSPHPLVSFGLALATGNESDAEYLDLVLAETIDLDALGALLSEALPEGIEVTGAAALVDRAPALQEAVTVVSWRIEIEPTPDAPDRVAAGLTAPTLVTTRHRKGRQVTEDVRPVVRSIVLRDDVSMNTVGFATDAGGSAAVEGRNSSIIEMELNTQPRGAKPGEVLAAIGGLTEVRALRTHQWIERDGARQEPLDADTTTMVGFATAEGGSAAFAGRDSSRPCVPEACAS